MEIMAVGGDDVSNKVSHKAPKSRRNSKQTKLAGKLQKVEQLIKEEGEMSDNEEVYEQFKEVKWMEWCEDVMSEEQKTLTRLQKLQSTSADLPKEKVLSRIRMYLQLIGRRIDQVVIEYETGPHKQERMRTHLWKYVSTFSNLSGEKLHQIYSKLKSEREAASGVGPSSINGSTPADQMIDKGLDMGKFEAWKRRKRAEAEASQVQPMSQRPSNNGNRASSDPNLGILGPPPTEDKQFSNGRFFKTHQAGFPSR